MRLELLGAAKITDFEGRFADWAKQAFWVDEDVVGLDVSVRDSLRVEMGKSLEELVHHLFDLQVAFLFLLQQLYAN